MVYNFHEFTMWLLLTIGTITSPEFHSFILAVQDAHCPKLFGERHPQSALSLVDLTLWNLSQLTGMRMIVRERILHASFREEVEQTFPLMVSVGALEFELDSPPLLY